MPSFSLSSIFLLLSLNLQITSELDEVLALPDSLIDLRIEKLQQFSRDTTKSELQLARANFQLAEDYRKMGFTDKSLELLSQSFHYYQLINDSVGLSMVMNTTSMTYSRVQEYDQALEALRKAEKYAQSMDQRKLIHANMGYVFFNLMQLDSAEKYLKISAIEYEELGELPIFPLMNLCGVNVARRAFDEALSGLLELERKGVDNLSLSSKFYLFSFIAALSHRQGDTHRTRLYINKRKQLEAEQGEVTNSLDFYETMAAADTLLEDYKSAAKYQQKYIALYKQLNKNNLATQLANYQKLFELKEKEAEIDLLEKENQLISLRQQKSRFYLVIAVLGILVLLLVIIIIYRSLVVRTMMNHQLTELNSKISKQKEDLRDQNELLENTISDLKQMQAKLIRSEKMASIGVFVSGVAHELNNPINVVNGGLHVIERNLSELLDGDLGNDPQLLEDVDTMLKESGRSIEKINKIIQALIMATYTDQTPIKVDISQVIDNVLLGLDLYEYRDLKFSRDTPSQQIECFPNRIHHAIKSLLENAFHFARKSESAKGSVTINTSLRDEELTLVVMNNGPKIQEDQLLKIFDPFFTTKEDEMSPGLGLYFAFSAVSEHHGSIEAMNTHEGVAFEMQIPLNMSNL